MTYPILYSPGHTDFNNLGLGVMIDTTTATVTEELNGKFELDLQYLSDGPLAQALVYDALVKVPTGDQVDQLFRIKTIIEKIDGELSVHAEHVSYIINDLPIKPSTKVVESVAQVALNKMLSAIADKHPLTAYSDITTISSAEWKVPDFKNPRNILGGVEGSILDQWGGEYQFDNYQIRLTSQRGRYSNTIIAYGRNLTDFEQEESILETYTSIYPYANETSNDSTVLRTLPEFFVDSEYVDKYPNRRVAMVDFSDKFNDKNPYSEEKLRKFAQSYVKANKVGVPKVTMKVSTVDLSGTLDESYNVEEVESLHLADTVKVFFEPLGVTAEAKVVGSVWNVLLEQYDSYTLGAKKASFGQWVNNNVNEIKNAANSAKQTAINAAISANGKNTNYYGNSGDGFPDNPKVGDLYFQRDGDKTTVYQWNGTSWVNIIDGNWQTDFEQEMQDKLDQAKQENDAALADLDKQLSDAQTAINNVDSANKALADAVDQANKDIQAVDDAAAKALEEAMTGQDLANASQKLAEESQNLANEAIDNFKNLSIGGRNLLRNTAFLGDSGKLPEYWTLKGGGTALAEVVDVTDLSQVKKAIRYVSSKTSNVSTGMRSTSAYENIKPGTTYTGSIWMRNNTDNPLIARPSVVFRDSTGANLKTITQYQTLSKTEGWVRITFSGEAPANTVSILFYSYITAVSDGAGGYLEQDFLVAAPKFEEGSVPTDWSPAPEDTQVRIEQLADGLSTTVSQAQYNTDQTVINASISRIDQKADSISSTVANVQNDVNNQATEISRIDQKADSISSTVSSVQNDLNNQATQISNINQTADSIISSVTDLEGDVAKQSSDIIQLSNSISLTVQKNDVINQINVSTEGILIAGEKVHITGTTLIDNAIITTAMIKELDASVITTGTIATNLIAPNAGNLLMNSQFNSNNLFDGWSYSTGTQWVRSGSYNTSTGLRYDTVSINKLTDESWSDTNLSFLYQDVRAYAGIKYSASVIAYLRSGSYRGECSIYFYDINNKIVGSQIKVIDKYDAYTLFKIEGVTAPTGTVRARFQVGIRGKSQIYVTCAQMNTGNVVGVYTPSTGQVIVGSDMIVDGAIIAKHLSAESVTAEKLAVGAVNMGSAVVTGTLDANRINVINLDASQIKVGTLNAATVRIINLDASAITTGTLNVAVQINANSIVAGTLNAKLLTGDTAHLNSVDTGNITNNYDYHLQVSSKGLFNKTTNVGQLNFHSTKTGGEDWDAAFPGSMTYHFETSTNGQNTGLRFWKNHIMSLNKDQNTGLYLNPYGGTQVRVTSRTSDNTYLAINASAFNVASDRRFKSDIKDYEENALSIVNGLRIRTYKKSGKREIGVIADEAPKALLLKDETGDMLSLYDYSSIAIKAIQELTDEVDSLKSQIEEMEKKIA